MVVSPECFGLIGPLVSWLESFFPGGHFEDTQVGKRTGPGTFLVDRVGHACITETFQRLPQSVQTPFAYTAYMIEVHFSCLIA